MTPPGQPAPSDAAPPGGELAETLAALRREVEDLRAAASRRAVVEQAKGVLVARHGISLDDAFDRLRQTAQRDGVRLVEAAAAVVGVPVLAARPPADTQSGPVSALLDSAAGESGEGDEAARLILDLLAGRRVQTVSLFRVSGDAALRLVGHTGFTGDLISAWRSIPLAIDVPHCRAVLGREPVWLPDAAAQVARFPAMAEVPWATEAMAAVPVLDAGPVIGVVGLGWTRAQDFAEPAVQEITSTVARVAPLLLRSVVPADPETAWLDAVLGVHFDPWILLVAVPSADGVVRDFVVDAVSSQVRRGSAWRGRRMRELWPSMAQTRTVLGALAGRGGTWSSTVAEPSEAPWGEPGTSVLAVRLGRRVVVVWRGGG